MSRSSPANARHFARTPLSSPSPAPTASRPRRRSPPTCSSHLGHDVQMGGNIGRAILTLEPPAPGRIHVVEMSSYQIDLTPTLEPSVAVLLNITPDHIDRHGSLAHYAAVKERLLNNAQACAVGIDDALTAAAAGRVEPAARLLCLHRRTGRTRHPAPLRHPAKPLRPRAIGYLRVKRRDRQPRRHRHTARPPQRPECTGSPCRPARAPNPGRRFQRRD